MFGAENEAALTADVMAETGVLMGVMGLSAVVSVNSNEDIP